MVIKLLIIMNKEIVGKIAIIGLGYVGLPLAVEFGKKIETIGFDINESRIKELNSGVDSTLEATPEELQQATKLTCTSNPEEMRDCNIYRYCPNSN